MIKKIFLIILFTLLTLNVFAEKRVTITEILNWYEKESIDSKLEKMEKEKIRIEEKGFLFEKKYKTDYTLKTNNVLDYDYKYPWVAPKKVFRGETNTNLRYKFVFADMTLTHSDDDKVVYEDNRLKKYDFRLDIAKINLGVTQSINDIFYSEEKYNENILKLKREKTENELKIRQRDNEEKIISDYLEVLNLTVETALKKNEKTENDAMVKSLKEQIEKGEATAIELEYLEVESIRIAEDIGYLIRKIDNQKRKLCEKVGMQYDTDYYFYPFPEQEPSGLEPSRLEILLKEIEKEIEKETLKMIKRKSQPALNVSVSYDIKNEDWNANIEFAGGMFTYLTEEKKKKLDIEKLDNEKEYIEQAIIQKRVEFETEYKHLLNSVKIANSMKEASLKKYDLTKKMLLKGYVSTIEYVKVRNEYKSNELSEKRSFNNLYAFNFKVKNQKKY